MFPLEIFLCFVVVASCLLLLNLAAPWQSLEKRKKKKLLADLLREIPTEAARANISLPSSKIFITHPSLIKTDFFQCQKKKEKKRSADIQQAANFLQKDRMTTTTAQTTPFPPYRIGPQTLAGLTVASPS